VRTFPSYLIERTRASQEPGYEPPPLRDASTVALVRDASGGLEVYLLRRVRGMAFAGGMHVFPGGSVDPADERDDIGWTGPPASDWARWFDTTEPIARSLVCAAVRETFEESGILLAGASADELLADVSNDEWEAERAALEAREHSLSELFARRGLVLRADLLRPMAHWITPIAEAKRFDTRFFVAEVPAGQVCRAVGGEADTRLWIRPQQALDDGLHMLPPTMTMLRDLASYDDVASALGAQRTITPVFPKFRLEADDALQFLLPGDPGY
jgi:8-oxo-dGTP pyrophosphatase MutT (NUDIX family)